MTKTSGNTGYFKIKSITFYDAEAAKRHLKELGVSKTEWTK